MRFTITRISSVKKISYYAHGGVLISEDEDFKIQTEFKIMAMYTEKAESLIVNKEPNRLKIAPKNQNTNQFMNLKYLGINNTSSRDFKVEIKTI